MGDTILKFDQVEKSFYDVPVLKGVSLEIERGQIVGLVGENGAGKSTLMNILGGVVRPESGRMLLNGTDYAPQGPGEASAAGIAFIHQELNLFTNLSVAENFFVSSFPHRGRTPLLDRRRMRTQAREFLAQVDLQLSPDTLLDQLSPGERQLVEVAKAISVDAQILIFDEPTTSLTARETERLFDLMARLHAAGKTIIYITHILADVLRLTDTVVVLRDGEVVTTGPTSSFTTNRMIASMVGRDLERLYPERTSSPRDRVRLELRHLAKAGIVHDLNLRLREGEILGVFGLMGSGRSEMAQIIFGMEGHDEGEILIDGQPAGRRSPTGSVEGGVAFVTEDRREQGLLMSAPVADNIALTALPAYSGRWVGLIQRSALTAAVRDTVTSLRIKVADAFRNPVKGLSGGNQQKVVLGKWLLANPSILIVDEPTRGVDVGAKLEIYTIIDDIAANGTAVLFISSEIEELIGMCDRILVMGFGEILGEFERAQFDREDILRTAFRENES